MSKVCVKGRFHPKNGNIVIIYLPHVWLSFFCRTLKEINFQASFCVSELLNNYPTITSLSPTDVYHSLIFLLPLFLLGFPLSLSSSSLLLFLLLFEHVEGLISEPRCFGAYLSKQSPLLNDSTGKKQIVRLIRSARLAWLVILLLLFCWKNIITVISASRWAKSKSTF